MSKSSKWSCDAAEMKTILKEIQEITNFNLKMQQQLTQIIQSKEANPIDKVFAHALQFLVDSAVDTRIKSLNIQNRLETIENELIQKNSQ
jgi:hypothetical protein